MFPACLLGQCAESAPIVRSRLADMPGRWRDQSVTTTPCRGAVVARYRAILTISSVAVASTIASSSETFMTICSGVFG